MGYWVTPEQFRRYCYSQLDSIKVAIDKKSRGSTVEDNYFLEHLNKLKNEFLTVTVRTSKENERIIDKLKQNPTEIDEIKRKARQWKGEGDNRRFQKGSGVFTCRSCGKQTRENGSGNSYVSLCPVCYDDARNEVTHWDEHSKNYPDANCKYCKKEGWI